MMGRQIRGGPGEAGARVALLRPLGAYFHGATGVALYAAALSSRSARGSNVPGPASSLYSLLARDHFVPRALAASVDSWEEFSANELLRRQRRFRAVAHLRGRRKRSAFATWALAASLASFDRESRLVLRRRLLAEAFSNVAHGPDPARRGAHRAWLRTAQSESLA